MARNVIKYRLTAEGTVPSFLYLGEDGVGGVYSVGDPTTPSPRDMVMIGITNDNATGDFEVIATKADLQSYLATVGAGWTQPDPSQSDNQNAKIPFDPAAATTWIWDKFTALGGVNYNGENTCLGVIPDAQVEVTPVVEEVVAPVEVAVEVPVAEVTIDVGTASATPTI